VTLTDLHELGFPKSFTRLKLMQLLAIKYPQYNWANAHLLRGRFAQQKRFEQAVKSLFPVHIHFPRMVFNLEKEGRGGGEEVGLTSPSLSNLWILEYLRIEKSLLMPEKQPS